MDEKIEEKVGYWIYSEKGCVINCSNCGERLELCYPDGTEIRATKYCPNCGAKMRDLTGGIRCRPIRPEIKNLAYLMWEASVKNKMCWNYEQAEKLAYHILDNKYRKETDTAKEIFEVLYAHRKNGVILVEDLIAIAKYAKYKYGVDLGDRDE